jgi:hypothetical protein
MIHGGKIEHQWKIGREKPKKSENNYLFQCHVVHHKSQRDFPGSESRVPHSDARG